ncbi:adenylate/guanylate cyclase domain-containing protein [Oligoflexus tunisiensis]|uniref:adenylate/guanylate cyclase domain-containing protein n=1 Tax=Oligoflexus tunisiensis TaxID=708132 RepID=UPI000ABA55ED|nr:adenylate/guanylate cyclase domain-containing protein [Oligoflexus tunisiensis]
MLEKTSLRHKLGLVTICLLVIAGSYYAMFQHYRSFRFTKTEADLIYRIEAKLLDYRLKMRGPIKGSGHVGILAIDERSIAEFGRWPFSRRYYAQAFENLKNLGVRWIGFDAIFSEPERTAHEDFQPLFQSLGNDQRPANVKKTLQRYAAMQSQSPADRSFQQAIADFQRITLGYLYFGHPHEAELNRKPGKSPFPQLQPMVDASQIMADLPQGRVLHDYPELSRAYGLISNTPDITAAGQHFAFFSNDNDSDAINRWVTLVANVDGQLMPSLVLKTAAEYMNREIFAVFDPFGIDTLALVSRDNPEDVLDIPIDIRGAGRMLINPLGPGGSFKHFSLVDAYNNTFSEEEKNALQGSILLLGGTAAGTNDIRPNAFDPAIDGVENHAAAIDNIIQGNFMRRPVSIYKTELLIILVVGLVFAPLMIFSHALMSGIAVLLFVVGYYYVDKHFWFGRGIWTFIAVPCLEIIAMGFITTIYKYMTEELERKKLKGAFQHYLSPEVINQMLEHPEKMQLGGVRRDLTVLFSDVRGFTTISESLSPEKLCELMNEYFTPMTSLILRSGGVLDKYIGDAIMAFWGAPVALPQHADCAAQVALDMLRALDQVRQTFKEKQFPPIDIGIGLNTGPMSVGNMGSTERFTYTVMGDAVNLGSRLEGLTKEYGVQILISEFTQKQLTPGRFFTRDLDHIRVKGKLEPVHVFELVRPENFRSLPDLQNFIETFHAARQAYREKRWEDAIRLFNACLLQRPGDKASALYVERCTQYCEQPPVDNWDGVYTFKHK